MRRSVVVLLALVGCFGSDEPKRSPDDAPVVVAPVAPKGPTTPAEKLEAARKAAMAGDHSAALGWVEPLLATSPDDAALWRLFEQEAVAAGQARAVFDRLDPATAIGGKEGPYHMLRATLALAAGAPADAVAAADAARASDPGGAAAIHARAVMAGHPAPAAAADPAAAVDPAAALASLAGTTNPKAQLALAAAAAAVPGYRAALLRADLAAERGGRAQALLDYGLAVTSGDPRGVIAGNLGRARLALAPGVKDNPAPPPLEGFEWSMQAAEAAVAESNAVAAGAALALARHFAAVGPVADGGAARIGAAAQAVVDGGDALAVAPAGLAWARAALAAGQVDVALQAARRAGATGGAAVVAPAAVVGAAAAWQAGDRVAFGEIARAATGPGSAALMALLVRTDRSSPAAVALNVEGVAAEDAVWLYLVAAQVDSAGATAHLVAAVAAADAVGGIGQRIATRLELESVARRRGDPAASGARSGLLALAQGASGASLRAEVAARASLADVGAGPKDAVVAGAWSGLNRGGALDAAPFEAAVSAWGEARALARIGDLSKAGDLYGAYNKALGAMPLHRLGPLATGTVRDGSQGLPVASDFELLSNLLTAAQSGATEDATQSLARVRTVAASAAVVAELLARREQLTQDLAIGRDLGQGLTPAHRSALYAAAAQCRSAIAAHYADLAPLPADRLAALASAEAAASAEPLFSSATAGTLPTADVLVQSLRDAALLSYSVAGGQVWGVALHEGGALIRPLGRASDVFADAARHLQSLRSGALGTARFDHTAGDKLRSALIDPFAGTLRGIGRYLVVGPPALMVFPVTTFPEQGAGLRYLVEIRQTGVLGGLGPLQRVEAPSEVPLKPDFLGVSRPTLLAPGAAPPVAPPPATPAAAPAAGAPAAAPGGGGPESAAPAGGAAAPATPAVAATAPIEAAFGDADEPVDPKGGGGATGPASRDVASADLTAGARVFSTGARILSTGDNASLAGWASGAPNARFIQISGVTADGGGGFRLADGNLSLDRIRATPLRASLVVITADAPTEVQLARARAFLDAGASEVLVLAWPVPEDMLGTTLGYVYEALQREPGAARAVSVARQSMLRDSLLGDGFDRPSLWGAFLVVGRP